MAIVIVALAAYGVAYDEKSTVFGLVQYAWGGLGASFGPVVIASLYVKTINKYGAFAAIVSGGLTSALWRYCASTVYGIHVNEILPGFLMGFGMLFLVSWITKRSMK